jgi:hypothetical protein
MSRQHLETDTVRGSLMCRRSFQRTPIPGAPPPREVITTVRIPHFQNFREITRMPDGNVAWHFT